MNRQLLCGHGDRRRVLDGFPIPRPRFNRAIHGGIVGFIMRLEIPTRRVILGLFVIVEGGLLVGFHNASDHNRATLAFTATATAGAFALHTYLAGIEERRAENAQNLIRRWNAPEMLPVRLVLREITENRLEAATLQRSAKGGEMPPDVDGKRAGLVTVLNFYEELAIATQHNTADEERLYAFFSGIIQQSATCLEGWIKNERAVDNEPDYYCEFLKLVARWAAWKK